MTHAKTTVVCLGDGRGGQVIVERLLIRALNECHDAGTVARDDEDADDLRIRAGATSGAIVTLLGEPKPALDRDIKGDAAGEAVDDGRDASRDERHEDLPMT